jgi:hypothetical protein
MKYFHALHHTDVRCKAFTLRAWKNRSLSPTRGPRVPRYALLSQACWFARV